ncbi:MAG: helix-turn-helix transcriptional regulator [Ferrovibrio sp.]|uniref:helix-turn-helix domain-containing protein n=1 Tax=Ferrovibrio sp. TaxID=1917215 RepID=UPI00260CD35B|nr:helix-turn-helix transcriptional regulator [Ferrovibrio sp.]MCW0234852.1 helix-turn-helix transcriptional regulator [Ferrovibrio sp.]
MNGMLAIAPARQGRPDFQDLLRHWRGERRMSQLGLATEAGISARHLCFLEKGRSQPSREMVVLLAQVLDIPLAGQNALLVAAGFAPLFHETGLDAPELSNVQQALDAMLAQQEPFPALVVDEGWEVRQRNTAAGRILGALRPYYDVPETLAHNAMHAMCHPGGMRRFMPNWAEFVAAYLQVLHREATQGLSHAAAQLREALLRYPDMPAAFSAPAVDHPMAPMQLRIGRHDLSFFVTLTTFAMPRDITLQQIKIECFFPADAATAALARRLAAEPNLSLFD